MPFPPKTEEELLLEVDDLVRSSPRPKTAAADVRLILKDIIAALFDRAETPGGGGTAATLEEAISGTHLAAWGDSLTSGIGEVPFTVALAKQTGFSVYNGGVGGESSVQIKNRMLADTEKHNWPTIIWVGRNDSDQPNQVKASIAEIVAALDHSNYVVLSILNGTDEPRNSYGYEKVTDLNGDLATIYGDHYLDVRAYLVSQGGAVDTEDDLIPVALHKGGDTLHLNAAGYALVGTYITEHFERLQSANMTKLLTVRAALSLLTTPTLLGKVLQIALDPADNLLELRASNGKMISFSGTGDSFNSTGNFYINGGNVLVLQAAGSTAFEIAPNAIYPKLQIVSPTFVGEPLAPTAAPGTASSQIATTSFVQESLSVFSANPANLVHPDRTRDYFVNAGAAIAAAVAGDTLVLPAPAVDGTVIDNLAQLYLSPGLSLHTEGFDIGSRLTSGDAITLTGGTGKIIGNNSRVFSNSSGAWGMGAYNNATPGMYYEVYDLHFTNQTTHAVFFSSDCTIHFYNCHFDSSAGQAVYGRFNSPHVYFHNCTFKITGTSIAALLVGQTVKLVFENCLIIAQNRTATDHLLGNAQVGEVQLISTTVLAESLTTSAVKANLLVLEGSTTITGLYTATNLVDKRQLALTYSAASDGTARFTDIVMTSSGRVTLDTQINTSGFQAQVINSATNLGWGPVRTTAAEVTADIAIAFADPATTSALVRVEPQRQDTTRLGYTVFKIASANTSAAVAAHTTGFVPFTSLTGVELLADPSFLNPAQWQVDTGWSISGGKAIDAGGGGKVWQDVMLTAGTTYQVVIEVESRDGGGIYFEFTDPSNGSGNGYFQLNLGINTSTYTPSADQSRHFSIKDNYGTAQVLSASLKAL